MSRTPLASDDRTSRSVRDHIHTARETKRMALRHAADIAAEHPTGKAAAKAILAELDRLLRHAPEPDQCALCGQGWSDQ